jgi:hypothetical protein
MMKRTASAGALVLLAAACGPGPSPTTAPMMAAPGTLESPPVYALLGDRQALDLESEQISALDSIGGWLSAENAPRTRRLQELRGGYRARGGAPAIPASEEARELVEQIRQTNRRAAEGVHQVLTPEQRARTCELFQDTDQHRVRRETVRQRDARGGQQPGRARRQAERPTVAPVWFWCAEDAAVTAEG